MDSTHKQTAPLLVGIDLGTTHSLAAVLDSGRARVLRDGLGDVLIPSAVAIDEAGTTLIGQAALALSARHPDRVAFSFKRDMGQDVKQTLGDQPFSPQQLSALVLGHLRSEIEASTGRKIDEVVITVPAYFDEAQRRATLEAAELADLRCERLLNEPTAAAIAYGLHHLDREVRAVVLDLGGGTFDVTVLEIIEGVIEIHATAGDTRLGGDDFTQQVSERIEETILSRFGRGVAPAARGRLRAAAERAKRFLSRDSEVQITLHRLPLDNGPTRDLAMMLTRDEVEERFVPLYERVERPIRRALRDAALRIEDVDEVLLVGGASRMPSFQALVARLFGKEPSHELAVDEVVALGAAVQAGLKAGDAALDDVVVTDVAPFSLGVDTVSELHGMMMSGFFTPVLERGTVLPSSRVKPFQTVVDGQQQLELGIYQGEHHRVENNRFLGKLRVEDLPPAPAGEQTFDARFTYDLNGLLEVEVKVHSTGAVSRLLLEGAPGRLSQAELDAARRALDGLKFHPRDALPNATVLRRAEALHQELKGAPRERLARAIADFEVLLERQQDEAIDEMREILASVVAELQPPHG